jgi:predicted ArsR family transcriptional regulator
MWHLPAKPNEANWLDVLSHPARLEIVSILSDRGPTTATELIDLSHASAPTVRRHLEALVAKGVVCEHAGPNDGTPGRPAARFWLSPEVRRAATLLLAILTAPIGSWPRRAPALQPGR